MLGTAAAAADVTATAKQIRFEQPGRPYEKLVNNISDVGLSRDGTVLVAEVTSGFCFWRIDVKRAVAHFVDCVDARLPGPGGEVAVSPDGTRFAVAYGERLFLFHGLDENAPSLLGTVANRWTIDGLVGSTLAFTSDGTRLAIYTLGPIAFLSIDSVAAGEPVTVIESTDRVIAAMAIRPGARDVVATSTNSSDGSQNGLIAVYEPLKQTVVWQCGHTDPVTAMAYNNDATVLVTGSRGGTLRFSAPIPGGGSRPMITSTWLADIDALALPDGTADQIVAVSGYYSMALRGEIWTTN
jgi:WD40 repeat protein